MLKEGLFNSAAQDLFKQIKGDFQQDNAPSHKAKKVMEFLKEKVSGRLLEHPPKSPDFNPIERMWSIIKHKIEITNPKTREELIIRIQDAGGSISTETVGKIIDHVHYNTLQLAIESLGKFQKDKNITHDLKGINVLKEEEEINKNFNEEKVEDEIPVEIMDSDEDDDNDEVEKVKEDMKMQLE